MMPNGLVIRLVGDARFIRSSSSAFSEAVALRGRQGLAGPPGRPGRTGLTCDNPRCGDGCHF